MVTNNLFLTHLQRIFLLLIFVYTLFHTAWLSDDAYITFRVIDNFINGYGVTWNVVERVQAYTHPLWMFLLAGLYYFSQEIYFTSLIFSIVISTLAVYLLAFKLSRSFFATIMVLSILILSKAFIDFSTSGLENPLSHLFLVLFYLVYFKQDTQDNRVIFLLAFISCLAILNRMDSILMYIPALLYVIWQQKSWKTIKIMMLAFLPFVAWEIFSLIYYGFLFPNTAYAKLNTGIPSTELFQQGLIYLEDSLKRDALTLFIIFLSAFLLLITKQWNLLPLMVANILALFYVVKIGGDFMTGRFLTLIFFNACLIISQIPWQIFKCHINSFTLIVLIALGFHTVPPTLYSGKHYNNAVVPVTGVADERGFYFQRTGLLRKDKGRGLTHEWVNHGKKLKTETEKVIVGGAMGFVGYYAGSNIYMVDNWGLSNAFLSKLPINTDEGWYNDTGKRWRIGHFYREAKPDYINSLKQGKNLIRDPKEAKLYDQITLITRGKLFTYERWKAILQVNFSGLLGNGQKI
jgi:arabinofuranosyltransferase